MPSAHRPTSLPPLPIIEPFRIRTVEPLRPTSRGERLSLLERAGWNLFSIPAEHVLIDLLTDSGTGAMSNEQWAAMMRADESYAGATSFFRFRDAVQEITGYPEVIPTHQGRAAEHLLFAEWIRPGHTVLSNTFFDTTRANVEACGGIAIDLPIPPGLDPTSAFPWKGHFDVPSLKAHLADPTRSVALVVLTLTNNALGGHPVHPRHIEEVHDLCVAHGVPLFLDAARFAENAGLVRERDPDLAELSPARVARLCFDHAEGCLVSAKKDGLANIGGFLALRDETLAARLRERLVVTEGFPTYGGLAGRDLEALAQGLHEALDESYLDYRLASVRYLCRGLSSMGLSVVEPPGGHAAFVDARRTLPQVPPDHFPGHSLACAFYVEGGIRGCEIGTLMFGDAARWDLLRLAMPRRVYTQSHVDYVVAIGARVAAQRAHLPGMQLVREPPALRHFTATLEPRAPWPDAPL